MNTRVSNLEHVLGPEGAEGEELDVAASVVQAAAVGAPYALVQAKDNDVLVTFDGTDPGAGVGFVLQKDAVAVWSRRRLQAAQFVQASAAAVVRIEPMVEW